MVSNSKYNSIAQDPALSDTQKVEAIFQEMKENGKVHQGTVKAFDHYVNQYLAHKRAK